MEAEGRASVRFLCTHTGAEEAERLEAFRRVRDAIQPRLREWLANPERRET